MVYAVHIYSGILQMVECWSIYMQNSEVIFFVFIYKTVL